MTAQKLGVK